jgi:hypothetical protein
MKDNCENLVELVVSSSEEAFERIWFRSIMMGDSPAVACFIQPASKPTTVRNHLSDHARSDAIKAVNTKRAEDAKAMQKLWSTMTIVIEPNSDCSVEYSFEDLERVDTNKLREEWRSKHFAGLQFIPDKR